MDNQDKRHDAGRNGMRLLEQNSGATEMHMEVIRKLMRSQG
jgi:hypothetical protein